MPFCTVNSQNRCFWPLFSFKQLQSGKAFQPSYQKALEQANLFRFQFLLGSLKVTLETKSVKGVKKLISPRNLLISSRTRIYNKKYQNARKMNFKTCIIRAVQDLKSSQFTTFNYSCEEVNCSSLSKNNSFTFQYLVMYEVPFFEKVTIKKVIDLRHKLGKNQVAGVSIGVIMSVVATCAALNLVKRSRDVINAYQVTKPQKKLTKDEILMQKLIKMVKLENKIYQ
ncbi:Hypothetical_protein [Hexamita inflata]|uniref:Hypothetical_protein n=1 Tax=Hexamita inflata TaxID=28002 RepID=A0ABP1H632_9EUKA